MATQVVLAPGPKFADPKTLGQLPVLFAEVSVGVFGQKPGGLNFTEIIEVGIANPLILRAFFFPGVNQVAPGSEFAIKTAGAGRIFAAYLKLAGAFHQAVCHPALEGRVIVAERAGREVEGIAICNAVTGVDTATRSNQRKKQ